MIDLLMKRRSMGGGALLPADVIMTKETNAPVLAICHAKGWCGADYMTATEAAAVSNIGQYFRNSPITHFEELKYFTRLTSIPGQAFQQCKSLASVELPSTITSIGQYAFYEYMPLSDITIPSNVTSIGTNAFRRTSLKSITSLPMTAPTIGQRPFQDVSRNGTLYVPSGSTGYNTWMSSDLTSYGWTKVEI